jgi:DNA-binding GntR family transcriptional regulator
VSELDTAPRDVGPAPATPDSAGGRALALRVHGRLREMILRGELAPGTVLPQARLARDLGVSRTPMREAFRLLQEEGLIDAEPDKRARVREVDPGDLDSTYGTRIMLESLGVGITVRGVTDAHVQSMRDMLARLRRLAAEGEGERWYPAHREFHQLATAAAAPQLTRQLVALREHCDRYIGLDRLQHTGALQRADAEHEALVDAFAARDEALAVRVIALHLARTSLAVMSDTAPEREPVATRTALRLVLPNTAG